MTTAHTKGPIIIASCFCARQQQRDTLLHYALNCALGVEEENCTRKEKAQSRHLFFIPYRAAVYIYILIYKSIGLRIRSGYHNMYGTHGETVYVIRGRSLLFHPPVPLTTKGKPSLLIVDQQQSLYLSIVFLYVYSTPAPQQNGREKRGVDPALYGSGLYIIDRALQRRECLFISVAIPGSSSLHCPLRLLSFFLAILVTNMKNYYARS